MSNCEKKRCGYGRKWAGAVLCFMLLNTGAAPAIEVIPLSTIDKSVVQNINLHLSGISAPNSCYISQRLQQQIEQAVGLAVEGTGVYQYQIHYLAPQKSVEQTQCQVWELQLQLAAPVVLNKVSISVAGEGKTDPLISASISNFPLKPGEKLQHNSYEKGKSAMLSAASLSGYFEAQWLEHQITVDRDNNRADIRLSLQTGPRYLFGDLLNTLNDDDKALITRLMPFQPGDFYHSDLLNLFNQRLKRSGYFESVLVRPVVNAAQSLRVPLEIIFKFKPKNQYSVGGGFSSDSGLRGRASWRRSRLNANGDSIETELFVSFPEQSLGLRYRLPLKNPAQNFISFQAGLRATNDNNTFSDNVSVSVKRHWLNQQADWQTIAHLRLERESFKQGTEERKSTSFLLPGSTLSRFRSDGELYPMWGDRQLFTIEAGSKDMLSEIDVTRALIQTRWIREFGQLNENTRLRWFTRLELGVVSTNDFGQLPSSLRFFAGGDQSVRGFGYQALSPRDNNSQLLGGQYLYTASTEVSLPVTETWRVAAFLDMGNAGNRWFEDPATGIGAGVHWLTPIGPVRVYVARGNSDFEKTWRLHFALGAAL